MAKYAIGIDYGTLSGRALLVDIADGRELCSATLDYPHAVMDTALPDGTKLGTDWALQHPQDYLDVLKTTVPQILKESGVNPADIIGVGIDFTACTLLPVKSDGTPLCFLDKYKSEKNAYVKLWKHHAAQDKADRMNAVATERGETWLDKFGGKISSEWAFPKMWQVLDESPDVYADADFFIEAGDWVVWQLTGKQTRNSCMAGYKALWNGETGYPSKEYFKACDPRLENIIEEKLNCPVSPLGTKAGEVTETAAKLTGLSAGTAVAVANVDAHVCSPAVKVCETGKMFAIMGTSTCHMVLGKEEKVVKGMCGVVKDGIMPGFYGFEAGQCCVGDHFAWFVDNALPAAYFEEAKKESKNIHKYLREKAEKLRPGESGLVALDWFNGNRSVLVDANLTGLILGLTLQTRPEEIYRALIEATAYGTRRIIEAFTENGVEISEFFATGGIADKDPMTMQIYADVINMPIRVSGTAQGPALGSAIFGTVAAGKDKGGYETVAAAAEKMGKLKDLVYSPNKENASVYDKLYAEYVILHDYFGRGANDVMKRLKEIKR